MKRLSSSAVKAAWTRQVLVFLVASVFGVVPAAVRAATQSSPIAISPDDKSVWVVNPDDNSVSEFDVTADAPVLVKKLTIGKEPNSVAINADGTRVFVATALDDKIAVLDAVKSKVLKKFPAGGVEPVALALSPNGMRLYVLNAASNTLSVFDTAPLPPTLLSSVDLSAFGIAPRALAVTDDGDADDADETIFVAMFYGQLRSGKTFKDEGQDDERESKVPATGALAKVQLGGELFFTGAGRKGGCRARIGAAASSAIRAGVRTMSRGCSTPGRGRRSRSMPR